MTDVVVIAVIAALSLVACVFRICSAFENCKRYSSVQGVYNFLIEHPECMIGMYESDDSNM